MVNSLFQQNIREMDKTISNSSVAQGVQTITCLAALINSKRISLFAFKNITQVVQYSQESKPVQQNSQKRWKPRTSLKSSSLHQCQNGGWLLPTTSAACEAESEDSISLIRVELLTFWCVVKDCPTMSFSDAPARRWRHTSNQNKSQTKDKNWVQTCWTQDRTYFRTWNSLPPLSFIH